MAERYDAYVIGAGPSGTVCAGELADGGMKVGIAERELVGGECSYWACIPSKTLLRPGEALEGARHAPGAREAITASLDAAAAFEWRDFMVSDHDDEKSASAAPWVREKGIALHRGDARITGPGRITIGDVEVDERLRTSADNVWAIGDVTGVALFTHVGKYQARVAAGDILGKDVRADYRALPRVTFCDPQVAGAGMTEQQARDNGVDLALG